MATHTLMPDSDERDAASTAAPRFAPSPRTAAGAKAVQRRRARVAGVRRPASGVLPSAGRSSAVVTADCGGRAADREFGLGRWGRLVTTFCLVAAAVLVAVSVLSTGASESVADVTVQSGDSLWSIALHAEPGADPRAVVDRIKHLNALDGDVVMVGAVLKVPTAGR